MVERVRADESVVGLVLTGSRGHDAFVQPGSDWDVRLIVRDEDVAEAEDRYRTVRGSAVEVAVLSLAALERVGEIGSRESWDRYSYVHVETGIDKLDGRIARLVADMQHLRPEAAARALAAEALDAYINSYLRSLKNARAGLVVEAHLDAAESIPSLLTALFAMHERVRPFNRFLGWELEHYPLTGDAWAAGALLPRLESVMGDGDVAGQASLFREMERLARANALGEVVDSWQPDLDWLRTGGKA